MKTKEIIFTALEISAITQALECTKPYQTGLADAAYKQLQRVLYRVQSMRATVEDVEEASP